MVVRLESEDHQAVFERILHSDDPQVRGVSRKGKAEIEGMFRRVREKLLGV